MLFFKKVKHSKLHYTLKPTLLGINVYKHFYLTQQLL